MTAQDKDLWRLEHILKAIKKIEEFSSGVKSFEEFIDAPLERSAIERQLMVIGEAVANLSENVKALSPQVSWKKIKALRNFLAHEYWAVDVTEVWNITQKRIPELKPLIVDLIKKLKVK